MTPTEFLAARYDEDEARASSGWSSLRDERWETFNEGQSVLTPRAVLADITAKRAILAEHEESGNYPHICMRCYKEPGWPESDWEGTMHEWPCPTIRLLAQPFAEHPDFDPAWRVA